MGERIPVIAIVGRTNVGKSSLFNALVGKPLSVVEDTPGVTRDRHAAFCPSFGFNCTLVDTGGISGEEQNSLREAVLRQCEIAVSDADLVLVVFDGVAGPHALDAEVVEFVRSRHKKVLWVANKCESESAVASAQELYSLGIDHIFCVSAAHRQGLAEVMTAARELLGVPENSTNSEPSEEFDTVVEESDIEVVEPTRPIRVALIGRPNVGKSSLLNRIVGEERMIVSDLPGTTRDSVDVEVSREGEQFIFVDTAGLRRKSRVEGLSVEHWSNLRTLRALARCDVAVLVLDATEGAPSDQDAAIAGLVHERGRGLIVVVNKWDAIEKDHTSVKAYENAIREALKFAPYAPILFVSAITGRRCPSIFSKVRDVYAAARQRVRTSDLNRILGRAFQDRPPPVYHGEPIKLFFATQTAIQPPTFVLFVNHPKRLNFSYLRYIKNSLREEVPFEGVDLKLVLRKRTSKEDRDRTSRAA